jgi:hypothetical protein
MHARSSERAANGANETVCFHPKTCGDRETQKRYASHMDPSDKNRPSESHARPRTQVNRQLIGIGLDGTEGEKRVTKGQDFVLMGGSRETHEIMQDLVIRMEEKLKRKGKRLGELGDPEFEDLVQDSMD